MLNKIRHLSFSHLWLESLEFEVPESSSVQILVDLISGDHVSGSYFLNFSDG